MEKYLPGKTDPMIHLEINEFLTRRFPSVAAYIAEDLVKGLVKIQNKELLKK